MRIQSHRIEYLPDALLQTAIAALVEALKGISCKHEWEFVMETIWLLEMELLDRGILPDKL